MLLWCILCCICILYFVLYLYFAFCDVFVGYFWLLAAADTSCGKQRPVDWWTDSGVGAASRALYFLIYFSIYYISLLSGFGNIWSILNRNPNFKDTNTIENTNTNANKMRNTKVSALPAPLSSGAGERIVTLQLGSANSQLLLFKDQGLNSQLSSLFQGLRTWHEKTKNLFYKQMITYWNLWGSKMEDMLKE